MTETTTHTLRMSVSERMLTEASRFFPDMQRMIHELLVNAKRAKATEVSIDFETIDTDGNAALLTISDNGCGIADMRHMLTLGDTGWDSEVVEPAGMGFLSVFRNDVSAVSVQTSTADRYAEVHLLHDHLLGAPVTVTEIHNHNAGDLETGTTVTVWFSATPSEFVGLAEQGIRKQMLAARADLDMQVTYGDEVLVPLSESRGYEVLTVPGVGALRFVAAGPKGAVMPLSPILQQEIQWAEHAIIPVWDGVALGGASMLKKLFEELPWPDPILDEWVGSDFYGYAAMIMLDPHQTAVRPVLPSRTELRVDENVREMVQLVKNAIGQKLLEALGNIKVAVPDTFMVSEDRLQNQFKAHQRPSFTRFPYCSALSVHMFGGSDGFLSGVVDHIDDIATRWCQRWISQGDKGDMERTMHACGFSRIGVIDMLGHTNYVWDSDEERIDPDCTNVFHVYVRNGADVELFACSDLAVVNTCNMLTLFNPEYSGLPLLVYTFSDDAATAMPSAELRVEGASPELFPTNNGMNSIEVAEALVLGAVDDHRWWTLPYVLRHPKDEGSVLLHFAGNPRAALDFVGSSDFIDYLHNLAFHHYADFEWDYLAEDKYGDVNLDFNPIQRGFKAAYVRSRDKALQDTMEFLLGIQEHTAGLGKLRESMISNASSWQKLGLPRLTKQKQSRLIELLGDLTTDLDNIMDKLQQSSAELLGENDDNDNED